MHYPAGSVVQMLKPKRLTMQCKQKAYKRIQKLLKPMHLYTKDKRFQIVPLTAHALSYRFCRPDAKTHAQNNKEIRSLLQQSATATYDVSALVLSALMWI